MTLQRNGRVRIWDVRVYVTVFILDGANIWLTRKKSCTVQQEAPWCLQSSQISPQPSDNHVGSVEVLDVAVALFHNSQAK